MAADRAGVPAAELEAVWSTTSQERLTVVYSALAQVGVRYKRSGSTPAGFDCSGLVNFAWASVGVDLPRNSRGLINAASPRTPEQLLPGDLVWRPGHIMLYLGVGTAVVQATQSGRPVAVSDWGRVKKFGSPIADESAVPAVHVSVFGVPLGDLKA
jgi:cell wall-associated NlpC family hydrolase